MNKKLLVLLSVVSVNLLANNLFAMELSVVVEADAGAAAADADGVAAGAADINAVDRLGRTALHRAVLLGDIATFRTLIRKGADVNAVDRRGYTALHCAVQSAIQMDMPLENIAEIVATLILHGANTQARCFEAFGMSYRPIDMAGLYLLDGDYPDHPLTAEARDRLNCVIETLNTTIKRTVKRTVQFFLDKTRGCLGKALILAVKANCILAVTELIEAGADVNFKDILEHTPLYYAIFTENQDLINLLIESGAQVDAVVDIANGTPLHHAASIGSVKAVTALLGAGASLEAFSWLYGYPLHSACASGSVEAVTALLGAGAVVDAKDEHDATPLYHAVFGGHVGVVEVLMRNGAKPELETTNGFSPIFIANFNKDGAIQALLRETM